jgi:hypothetical protein
MNDAFLRDYAKTVRSIADADPFTKARLLVLAARYEGSVGRPLTGNKATNHPAGSSPSAQYAFRPSTSSPPTVD